MTNLQRCRRHAVHWGVAGWQPHVPGFSASSRIVAYRTGATAAARQLTWLDRSRKSLGTLGGLDTASLNHVELSPDGKRVAVGRAINGNGSPDLWLIDVAGCTYEWDNRSSQPRDIALWKT